MIISNMRELARYGSGITLDKCSIGFSGRLLKNDAKVSLIKMDFSLFKEYTASAELMKPLEDTIKMLHSLDYDVCISSVETMEQYQIAKQLGGEYIQGFYLSDALSPEKVKNFIQDWQ